MISTDELQNSINNQIFSIMAKWNTCCFDTRYGGYLTCRARDFSLYDEKKGAWGQARHIYTYSLMAEYDKDNKEYWLSLARDGIYFVLNKMLPSSSLRVNYLVSREGETIDGPISIFSDAFTILGLAKYIQVSKDRFYLGILLSLYTEYEKNILNSDFKDIAPNVWEKDVKQHAVWMISANVAYEVSFVLGQDRVKPFLTTCLDTIFNILVDKSTNILFEKKYSDGSFLNTHDAKFINVGHVFESMWFCLDCADLLKNDSYYEKIIKISEAVYDVGSIDGLIKFSANLDYKNEKHSTWKYEIAFEETDKVSWAYAEAMVLFIYLYKITKEQKWYDRFLKHYDFVNNNFVDTEFGDWFHALNNDGSVKIDIKGSTVKDAYHIPRALIKITSLLNLIKKGGV